ARNSLITLMVDYLEARMSLLLDIGILRTSNDTFWNNESAVIVDLQTGEHRPEDPLVENPGDQGEHTLMTPEELFEH
ncbi:MAG: hypothetical protein HOH33_02510, partial [Verrucomicrobia bacterium]|nr:hypothetical protein [Verrucomicrobiota bacterium]